MTNLNLNDFPIGQEVEINVLVRGRVTSRPVKEDDGSLVIDLNGTRAKVWSDSTITGLPTHCFKVTSMKKYIAPLPTGVGSLVERTTRSDGVAVYARREDGDWVRLSGDATFWAATISETSMDNLNQLGRVRAVRNA